MQPNNLTNLALERALLGILLVDPDAYPRVSETLRAEHFADHAHRLIYGAVEQAALEGEVNFVTVANLLEAKGEIERIGGSAYLTRAINEMVLGSVTYADPYAKKVVDLSRRRDLLRIADMVARDAYDMSVPVADVQASAESALLDAAIHTDSKASVDALTLADGLVTRVSSFIRGDQEWGAVATGLLPLDDCLAGGMEPGVFVVAGVTGIGKTAVMLQIAADIAMRGKRVIVFSIEMSSEQIGMRLATSLSRVPLRSLKAGATTTLQNSALIDALGQISEWPLTIVDQSQLRPSDVLLASQRVALEHKDLAAVFVDGLWLMTAESDYGNRVQELTAISRGVKVAQRHLNVPIMITHQLSRAPSKRSDPRPLLSDLRDAGSVEQDADVVLMLYREKYYDQAADDVIELWIRKNRFGGSNELVKMYWVQELGRLERLSYADG